MLADRPALEGGDGRDRERACGLAGGDDEEVGDRSRYLLQRLKPGTRLVAQQQAQEQPDLTARPGAEGVLVEDLPQRGGHLGSWPGVQRDAGQLQRDPVAGHGRGAVAQGVEVLSRGHARVPVPRRPVRGGLQAARRLRGAAGAPVVLGHPRQREGTRVPGQGTGRAQVQNRPLRFGDRLVRGPARQVVGEDVPAVVRGAVEDAFPQRRRECSTRLRLAQPRDGAQQFHRRGFAEDRRRGDHLPRRRRKATQPLHHHPAHGRGQGRLPRRAGGVLRGVRPSAQYLLDDVRQAARPPVQTVGELVRDRLRAEQPGGQRTGLRRRQRCEVPLDHRHVGRCAQRERKAVAPFGVGVGSGTTAGGEYEAQAGRRVGDDRAEECAGRCVGPLEVLDDEDGLPQRCRVRVQGAQDAVVFGPRVSQGRRRGREAIREVGQQSVQGPGHRRQVRRERPGAEAVQRLDERREGERCVRLLAAGHQRDGIR